MSPYTLEEELAIWVDKLLEYRRRAGVINFQLEKADDFLNNLRRIRHEMAEASDEITSVDGGIYWGDDDNTENLK